MNVLPVITRELRAESRHAVNYWLRVLGIVALLLVLLVLVLKRRGLPASGGHVFAALHLTLLLTICVLVPVMTADCLAREKREGTLGLLFLTPLNAREIVIGKSVVHALRALTLLLVAVPLISIPLLMGGVAWLDIFTAFGFQFCALLLSVAAGLTASAAGKVWVRTLILAEALAITLFITFGWALAFSFLPLIGNPRSWPDNLFGIEMLVIVPAALLSGYEQGWSDLLLQVSRAGPLLNTAWIFVVIGSVLFSLMLLCLAIVAAGQRIQKSWQEEPPSRRQLWLYRRFCTPLNWRDFFRKRMKRALARNPIGWLHQYSWSARLSKWGWCIVIVLAESLVPLSGDFGDMAEIQPILAVALLLGMAFSASGSFRKEREVGALELILVTPLTTREIIRGRLTGIYGQFGISLLIVMGTWRFLEDSYLYRSADFNWPFWMMLGNFVLIPIVGLHFSLRTRHFVLAFLCTCGVAMFLLGLFALPLFVMLLVDASSEPAVPALLLYFLLQAGTAALFLNRLEHNLSTRNFLFPVR